MSDRAIYVRDLKKVFRKRTGRLKSVVSEEWALRGVSFVVAHGETYGLLGPNGSGKSTLIRVLSTLLAPDGGEVWLMGHRLPEGEREVRRKLAE
jgi:ABC-2 type transport system ATP-binding protein